MSFFTEPEHIFLRTSPLPRNPATLPTGRLFESPPPLAAPLAAILRAERPHVVVTYPEDGGYPHPDHIMTHEVTVRALEIAEDPGARLEPVGAAMGSAADGSPDEPWRVPKVYACHAFPPDRVLALHEALLSRVGESPFEGWMERRAERDEWPCHAEIRVDEWFGRRDEALRAHASQVDPSGTWFAWPRELERDVYPWECFTLLRSDVDVPDREDDLFAGLDLG
jgi:mycothiol S-conjugate amidase